MSKTKSFAKLVKDNILFILILTGVVSGFLIGIFLNDTVQNAKGTKLTSKELAMLIGFPGELFLRMLMLVVIPFILSSIITSVTLIDKNTAAKIGKCAGFYSFITVLISVCLAVGLATIIIKSHVPEHEDQETNATVGSNPIYSILDMLRNMIPDNIVETSISSTGTKLKGKARDFSLVNKSTILLKSSVGNLASFLKKEVINPWSLSPESVQVIREENVVYEYAGQEKYHSSNILGVLVLSILFGVILSGLGEKAKPLVDLCTCLFEVTMKMVQIFMWFSPIGISSIIAGKLVAMHDIQETIENLGLLIATVIIVVLIHGLIILPFIFVILLRRNPFPILSCVAKSLLTALGTGSGSATVPVTLICFEKKNIVNKRLAQFWLPIGSMANAPGTVIDIAIATVFVVKTYHPHLLNLSSSILICFASMVGTLACPPIAGAVPIVVQTLVLEMVGMPLTDVGILWTINWLLDRLVTPLNVWANALACVVIEKYCCKELQLEATEPTCDSGVSCEVDIVQEERTETKDSQTDNKDATDNTVVITIPEEEKERIETFNAKNAYTKEDIALGA